MAKHIQVEIRANDSETWHWQAGGLSRGVRHGSQIPARVSTSRPDDCCSACRPTRTCRRQCQAERDWAPGPGGRAGPGELDSFKLKGHHPSLSASGTTLAAYCGGDTAGPLEGGPADARAAVASESERTSGIMDADSSVSFLASSKLLLHR
jgi:hypothetical protein